MWCRVTDDDVNFDVVVGVTKANQNNMNMYVVFRMYYQMKFSLENKT